MVEAVGQDYSRWNDVYLTLRGRYGDVIEEIDDSTGQILARIEAAARAAAAVATQGKKA